MTLRAQITADVANVFHRTDDFAEEIIHYKVPGGQPETITAVVDYDFLEQASRQFGVLVNPLTDDTGVRIKDRALLELSIDVAVTEELAGGKYPSTFEIFERDENGDKTGPSAIWVAKRLIGKDHAMQSVEIWRTDQKATRRMS